MDKKEFLEKLVTESELSQEDKKFWEVLISSAPDFLIENISELLAEFPDKLLWLNQIYQRKKVAFSVMEKDKEKGQALLSEIYKEEKEAMEGFLTS